MSLICQVPFKVKRFGSDKMFRSLSTQEFEAFPITSTYLNYHKITTESQEKPHISSLLKIKFYKPDNHLSHTTGQREPN